jgi:phosphoglycerol transferase
MLGAGRKGHPSEGFSAMKKVMLVMAVYGGALALCMVLLGLVLKVWRVDLTVPFHAHGDGLVYHVWTKGLCENGWYLHNRFTGLPDGTDMHDFPMADNLHFAVLKLLTLVFAPIVACNLYCLLTFPLATWSALLVFRHFRLSGGPALVASLLFTFLPYHFFRGLVHLFLAGYYLVPLIIMVILWVHSDWDGGVVPSPRPWPRRRWAVALLICGLVGSAGVYYAFFACFLLLVAGLTRSLGHRQLAPLARALVLIATLSLAVFVNLSPTLLYLARHGKNTAAVQRACFECELTGLKIVQLLLPVTGHRVHALAHVKGIYNDPRSALNNENDSASLGLVGAVGFVVLAGRLLARRGKLWADPLQDSLANLNAWAVALGTVGGLGSLFAVLVSPWIRAYNRISIYIAFMALFAVALLLDRLRQTLVPRGRRKGPFSREPEATAVAHAVASGSRLNSLGNRTLAAATRYLTGSTRKQLLFTGLLGVLLTAGVLDQTGYFTAPYYHQAKSECASTAEFVQRIETQLPEQAWIYQLPYVPFFEHMPPGRMAHYDHLQGYLFSKNLCWSYGAMASRPAGQWQRQLAGKPVREVVRLLCWAGFSGLYVDRFGYGDNGAAIEAELTGLLREQPLVSWNQRLVFFNLQDYNRVLRQSFPEDQWPAQRLAAMHPVEFSWHGGFRPLEGTWENTWRWCVSTGELHILNSLDVPRTVVLTMDCKAAPGKPALLRIQGPSLVTEKIIHEQEANLALTVTVPPGTSVMKFACAACPGSSPYEPQNQLFRIANFSDAETVPFYERAPK